jgi:hypothetical protein
MSDVAAGPFWRPFTFRYDGIDHRDGKMHRCKPRTLIPAVIGQHELGQIRSITRASRRARSCSVIRSVMHSILAVASAIFAPLSAAQAKPQTMWVWTASGAGGKSVNLTNETDCGPDRT